MDVNSKAPTRSGGMWRSRWAAIGAAVAVTLGAGGLGIARATISSGSKPVFVAIAPCRLVDTRPAPATVGPRATPLNPNEIATFTVHGANGNCNIPAGAVAIDANVTITDPTSDGYLTVFPSDAAQPTASNLNWTAGQAPTPNAVTVDLSADGKISVFNERGTVNVIIDIVGYYEDHNHDDRYVQLGPIVMSHPGLDFQATENAPTTFEQFITWTRASGDGRVNLALDAPTSIAGQAYRLTSVTFCVRSVSGGGFVTQAAVWNETGQSATSFLVDDTDRTSAGCYTFNVPAPPAGTRTWQLNLALAGGGAATVGLSTVQSTWSPVGIGGITLSESDAPAVDTSGQNGG